MPLHSSLGDSETPSQINKKEQVLQARELSKADKGARETVPRPRVQASRPSERPEL